MDQATKYWFDHEKLDVYQESIDFVAWLSKLLEESSRLGDIKDQLDRAANSVVLNLAVGNGKYSVKDRCRFLDTATASALECAAGLDILVAKRKLTRDDIRPGKESLRRIVQMMMGLIRKNSSRPHFREQRPVDNSEPQPSES
jgi:four helix bundle protein